MLYGHYYCTNISQDVLNTYGMDSRVFGFDCLIQGDFRYAVITEVEFFKMSKNVNISQTKLIITLSCVLNHERVNKALWFIF